MNNRLGRIKAAVWAAEETMSHPKADKEIQTLAKVVAYDHIKKILDEEDGETK